MTHEWVRIQLRLMLDPKTGKQLRKEVYSCVACGWGPVQASHRSLLDMFNFPPCLRPRTAWDHLLADDGL